MQLGFNDGETIDVKVIFGKSEIIDGIERDVLTIEIDPSVGEINDLIAIFSNPKKTQFLYDKTEHTQEIGEGYCKLVYADTIRRKIKHAVGKILPDVYETIHIVKLAQLTYDEYQTLLQEID